MEIKAVLLLSGGLDSILAGRLLLEQGIAVEALNFTSPFCNCTPKNFGCSAAQQAANQLGIPVKIKACGEAYLEIMKHPRFGRGSGMNACLDCRVHLFARAKEYMAEIGASFVATGEVLGERPMSQRRDAMHIIERESGLEGFIVRPLSAQHFKPSIPEVQGWVDRSRLLAFQGRGRAPQIQLAEQFNIHDYPCPAGGCLLTDKEFSLKFRELLEHQPDFKLPDARLLKYGRHFRLPGGAKVIVGRNENENHSLQQLAGEKDSLLSPDGIPGPTVLVHGTLRPGELEQAKQILIAYLKGAKNEVWIIQAAEERGILNSLFAVDGIARSMEKALAINPKDGNAQHVLGVLYRKAPGWPLSRGDMKKSLEYARAAVADKPDVVLHHLGLAETLVAMGQKEEAKMILQKCIELPGPADFQPETKLDREKARSLLATLK